MRKQCAKAKRIRAVIFLKSPFRIWRLPEGAERKLQKRFPDVEFRVTERKEELKELLRDADVLLCWRLPEEFFPLAMNLKWVHTALTGVEDLLFPKLIESNVVLTNSRGVASKGIAEHIIGAMLCLSRKIFESVQHQMRAQWGRYEIWESDSIPCEIEGKTVGILGYGSIGRELAGKCKALGMRVITARKTPSKGKQSSGGSVRLMTLLRTSDFVVISLPLTQTTEGIIGERELKWMKRGAYLINVARGEIVQEKALMKALNEGWIAGAALDVFETEPLPDRHPLYSMPNILITPHIAGTSPGYMDRVVEIFGENLHRFLQGKRLKNIVDKKLGY